MMLWYLMKVCMGQCFFNAVVWIAELVCEKVANSRYGSSVRTVVVVAIIVVSVSALRCTYSRLQLCHTRPL